MTRGVADSAAPTSDCCEEPDPNGFRPYCKDDMRRSFPDGIREVKSR
jgi:hypothetical protein